MTLYRDGVLVVEREGEAPERHMLAPAIEPRAAVAWAASRDGRSAMIGLECGEAVVHAGADSKGVRTIVLGERIPNAWQLDVVAIADGFLVRFERGLVCVATNGRERWRSEGVTFDWRFVAERDGGVWLVDESGNLVGFDVATGVERT